MASSAPSSTSLAIAAAAVGTWALSTFFIARKRAARAKVSHETHVREATHASDTGEPPRFLGEIKEATFPIIVGIGGASGSGKSSVAEATKKELKKAGVHCTVVSCDSYYKGLGPDEEPENHNFDDPAALEFSLLARQLDDLKAGKTIEVPKYDFTVHKRLPESQRVEPPDVILIDGIFALAVPEVRDRCDLRIFTMEDPDVCLARRVRRDIHERARTLDSVLEQYQRWVKPSFKRFVEPSMVQADLIVPNGRENKIALSILARELYQLCNSARDRADSTSS